MNKSMYDKPQKSGYTTLRPTIDTGEGITEQSHKEQCDINCILADYYRTGLVKHAAKHQGKYDDVDVQDFQQAMFIVNNAMNMFNELPAQIRDRFNNDPASFLDFVQNPKNKDEMEKLGILKGNDGIDISGAPSGAPVKSQALSSVEETSTDDDASQSAVSSTQTPESRASKA